MNWFWLSFVDPRREEGKRFLGVSLVEAKDSMNAVQIARIHDCNPGGEVKIVRLSGTVPEDKAYRLLGEDEAHELAKCL